MPIHRAAFPTLNNPPTAAGPKLMIMRFFGWIKRYHVFTWEKCKKDLRRKMKNDILQVFTFINEGVSPSLEDVPVLQVRDGSIEFGPSV